MSSPWSNEKSSSLAAAQLRVQGWFWTLHPSWLTHLSLTPGLLTAELWPFSPSGWLWRVSVLPHWWCLDSDGCGKLGFGVWQKSSWSLRQCDLLPKMDQGHYLESLGLRWWLYLCDFLFPAVLLPLALLGSPWALTLTGYETGRGADPAGGTNGMGLWRMKLGQRILKTHWESTVLLSRFLIFLCFRG